MKDPQVNPKTVLAQFDRLTSTYTRLFQLCYDTLGPDKSQVDRDALREVLKNYIKD